MAQGMRLRARYKVVGPKLVPVKVNKSWMDKETSSLQQEVVTEEKSMYMVYFPQGHSIRIDRAELVRLGYHIKPRIVNMDTGDVVDFGGDAYDLDDIPDRDVVIDAEPGEEDQDGLTISRRSKKE